MARGSDTAQTAAKTGLANSGTYGGNAGSLYSSLAPQLTSEAAHPTGFSEPDLAAMNTAAQQSAGGSEAGAVGQGALLAERTKNAGGPAAAIAESAREAGRQMSQNALGIRTQNAQLKEQQRRAAMTGLQGLYGTSVGGSNAALGEVAPNVNANTQAASQSWDWARNILQPALAAAGGSSATIGKAFGV